MAVADGAAGAFLDRSFAQQCGIDSAANF